MNNLKEIMIKSRKEKGLKQDKVAKTIGMSQSNYSKVERGLLVPSAIQWVLFCNLVEIPLDSLKIYEEK